METPPRTGLTLTGLFASALLVVAVGVALLSWLTLASARRTLLERSERQRAAAAARIAATIERELGEAAAVLADVERQLSAGVMKADDPAEMEGPLLAQVLAHRAVAEVAFTRGPESSGRGTPGPWQVALLRARADEEGAVWTRLLRPRPGGGFSARLRERGPGEGLDGGVLLPPSEAPDPSAHPTYTTAAAPEFRGQVLWSDLHWEEMDLSRPPEQRRVVVGVQKSLLGGGALLGVLRVELRAAAVDELARVRVDESDPADPHRVFLCDAHGRLLTRLDPADRVDLDDDDLRVRLARRQPAVERALASAALAHLDTRLEPGAAPVATDAFVLDGQRYLVTFRALPSTQGWIAGIVVPEAHYTRDLRALATRLLGTGALALLLALVAAAAAVRVLRRGLGRLVASTARMRAFDFQPGAVAEPVAELAELADGLERARTALRAMARYVPVDLVRRLYADNQEPRPGGEPRVLTLLFSDIEGFTSLAERLPPARLAEALGAYLDALSGAISETGGTIDKFIGDAVMAFWNAPAPLGDHAARACRAALACERATTALFASPAWADLPPLHTRYGLHTGEVLIGHFGSRERLGYTALGDSVNLAARLEGQCKAYGVTRLVSQAVVDAAGPGFCFRRLDRVAVKGKSRAVTVYQLLEAAPAKGSPQARALEDYQSALDLYFARRFNDALAVLAPHKSVDPPSQMLAVRCRELHATPPPPDWDGTFVARTK